MGELKGLFVREAVGTGDVAGEGKPVQAVGGVGGLQRAVFGFVVSHQEHLFPQRGQERKSHPLAQLLHQTYLQAQLVHFQLNRKVDLPQFAQAMGVPPKVGFGEDGLGGERSGCQGWPR